MKAEGCNGNECEAMVQEVWSDCHPVFPLLSFLAISCIKL
jgi:hypothetical protein